MPGPIQVIPPGLMGLLQLKTGGNLPSTLADVVAPVLELRDWYLTARRVDHNTLFGAIPQRVLATGNNGNFGFQLGGVNVQVPQNQIWYCEEMTINANLLAADYIRAAPTILTPGAGASFTGSHLVGPDVNDVVTARARSVAGKADRGFWAFPGDIFGVQVFDILSAGITLNLFLRATPCPA